MFQRSEPPQAPLFEFEPDAFSPDMLLCGINTPLCAIFLIDKPEFILGKAEDCDGVISFSNEISRNHAKICWRDGQYFLCDLDSNNKTFLNGQVLVPHQESPIAPGDRIAFSTWIFRLEKINK